MAATKRPQESYFTPRREVPDDTIFTKFGTAVNLTCVMTSVNFGCYRLKSGHSAVINKIRFSSDIEFYYDLTSGKH